PRPRRASRPPRRGVIEPPCQNGMSKWQMPEWHVKMTAARMTGPAGGPAKLACQNDRLRFAVIPLFCGGIVTQPQRSKRRERVKLFAPAPLPNRLPEQLNVSIGQQSRQLFSLLAHVVAYRLIGFNGRGSVFR